MHKVCTSRPTEVELTLKRIVKDFEQLERAIDSAITDIKACGGLNDEVASLERARLAACRGAALAKKGFSAD